MNTREAVLALFESNKGIYLSGEEIAARVSISRAAVWKVVRTLRSEGYEIDGIRNKGYRLSADTDILSAQGIQKYLTSDWAQAELCVLPEAGSTNTLMREKAEAGAPEGSVILANSQTGGKGRQGRSFYSPADTGIYMSILLRPSGLSPEQAVKITTMAAVAMCEAIEEASGKQAQIKWVNDIYVEGKKVCGILTEASVSMENNCMESLVLGVGLNVYAPAEGFPQELRQIAGAVFDSRQKDGKNLLAAGFLNRVMRLYRQREQADYAAAYRSRSMAIGKEVTVLKPSGSRKARALDVDDSCALLVEYKDGTKERLTSGEIRIRLMEQEERK